MDPALRFGYRRMINVKYGNHVGRHYLYLSEPAFRRDHKLTPIVEDWRSASPGDWVRGDDGSVLQLLARKVLDNGRNLRPTTTYRFAFGTIADYERKNGTRTGSLTMQDRKRNTSPSSLALHTTRRYGKHSNKKKQRFAFLVLVQNVTPHRAYMKAFGCLSVRTARFLSQALLKNEKEYLIMEAIKTQREVLDGAGLTDEYLAEQMKEKLQKAHGKEFKDLLQFTHELKGNYTPPSKTTIIPPPPQQLNPPRVTPTFGTPRPAQLAEFTDIPKEERVLEKEFSAEDAVEVVDGKTEEIQKQRVRKVARSKKTS